MTIATDHFFQAYLNTTFTICWTRLCVPVRHRKCQSTNCSKMVSELVFNKEHLVPSKFVCESRRVLSERRQIEEMMVPLKETIRERGLEVSRLCDMNHLCPFHGRGNICISGNLTRLLMTFEPEDEDTFSPKRKVKSEWGLSKINVSIKSPNGVLTQLKANVFLCCAHQLHKYYSLMTMILKR